MERFIFFAVFLVMSQFYYSQDNLSEKQIDSALTVIKDIKLFNNEGIAKLTELYYQAKEIDYKNAEIKILKRIIDIEAGANNSLKAYEYILDLKPLALSVDDFRSYITACNLESKIFFMITIMFVPKLHYQRQRNICQESKIQMIGRILVLKLIFTGGGL